MEIRKLTRVGKRSICVVIPAEFVEELGWRERQKVVLNRTGTSITIHDYNPKRR